MEEAHVKIIWVAPLLLVMLLPALACNTSAQASSQNAAEDLRGTSWQLVKFQRSDEQTLAPDDKSKYTIAFGIDSQVNVRIDCNRGRGNMEIFRAESTHTQPACAHARYVPARPAQRSHARGFGVGAVLHAQGWSSFPGVDGGRRHL